MRAVDELERAEKLDGLVGLGQRWARLLRAGRSRDALHGVRLGHGSFCCVASHAAPGAPEHGIETGRVVTGQSREVGSDPQVASSRWRGPTIRGALAGLPGSQGGRLDTGYV